MSAAPTPQVGSGAWQAGYLKQHAAEQGRYLESVATSDVVQQLAERAMALLALQPGQRVLELGCGSGVFLPRLAAAVGPSGSVVGLDHSAELIAQARTKVADAPGAGCVSLQVGDAYRLPFPNASFDAAHCERVLMHLDDPNAALAELARVVRPGGVVVAAEPDWAGVRIDHPDRELFDRVLRASLRHRQPDMGLTLFRRFGEVGLVDRRHATVSTVIEDFGTWLMFGLDLGPGLEQVKSEGGFDAERIAALAPALEAANAAGRFYSAAIVHAVAGVVPAAR